MPHANTLLLVPSAKSSVCIYCILLSFLLKFGILICFHLRPMVNSQYKSKVVCLIQSHVSAISG